MYKQLYTQININTIHDNNENDTGMVRYLRI